MRENYQKKIEICIWILVYNSMMHYYRRDVLGYGLRFNWEKIGEKGRKQEH